MEEACWMVPKLAIPEYESVYMHVRKPVMEVHDACTELEKVQLELNLQISELQLKG